MIGGEAIEIPLSPFVSADCPLDINLSADPLEGFMLIADSTSTMLVIYEDDDLDLAGTEEPYYTDYTVTIIASDVNSDFELECAIEVEVKNPCAALSDLSSTMQ